METYSEIAPEKMAERSIILRKKLDDLESFLLAVCRLPMQPESRRHNQIIAEEIHQRFIFLKNLLAAEIASQPNDSSAADQLHEIEEKIGDLETSFHGWDDYRNKYAEIDDDSVSFCSDCAAIGLLEDGDLETHALEDYAPAEKKKLQKLEKKERGMKWREKGKCWGVFGSGIIIGGILILGLVSFCSSLVCRYDTFFLSPT